MIKETIIYQKEKINQNKKEHSFLLELNGDKNSKKIKRKKLNLSLVIDVSGSMNLPLNYDSNYNHNYKLLNKNIFQEKASLSKLDLVKDAAIKSIKYLKNDDYISIIAFDDQIKIISPTIKIDNNKEQIIEAIKSLKTSGMTNLHGGWFEGCQQVSKNISDTFLNRVILLTDGQINSGQQNKDLIIQDVLNIYNNSISTTCFGVGSDFNESLLQHISNSGGGNFYYIENNKDVENLFEEEFSGINQLSAYDCELSFHLNDNIELVGCENNLSKNKESYILPNILNKKQSFIFNIKTKKEFDFKTNTFGQIILKYKNEEGKTEKLKIKLNFNNTNNSSWNKLDDNNEYKVIKTLFEIARLKEEAGNAIAEGNVTRAKNLLNDSISFVARSNINDSRIIKENNNLEATLLASESKNLESFKKDLSYQTYKTRNNK
jgi:Ca-activated chloride channel family protein